MNCKMAGAKARFVLQTLLARLKPCPCYKALSSEFFLRFADIIGPRPGPEGAPYPEPCPCYKALSIKFFTKL